MSLYLTLAIPVIFCLLLLFVKIVDLIYAKGAKAFWKRHIIDTFPYPDECFECNEHESCGECPMLLQIVLNRKGK